MSSKKKTAIPLPPEGFFDIVPEEQKYWYHLWRKINGLLGDYSFGRIDLGPAEQAELFTLPVAGSDPDRGRHIATGRFHGTSIALRAAMAPSLMRAYQQHGMSVLPHPVKLFSNAPVIGAGDDKQHPMHWELAVQTIGEPGEAADAELLFLGCRIMEALNIGPFTVRLNTVGDPAGRPVYLRALREFFKNNQKKISARVTALVKEHPFKALEALAIEHPDIAKDAPQSVNHLSDEARVHFKRLLEFLDEGEVPYVIDHTLVTTDDYATHTIWEFVSDGIAATETTPAMPAATYIRGGRMDRLGALLGGPHTPTVGWSLRLDGLVAALKAKGVELPEPGARPKVFLSQLGDAAKKRSLILFEEIRKSGIEVRYSLSRDTIKGQLRVAAKLGVKLALIFGQKEALEGTVMVREMETGIQETIPLEKIIDELKKRLRAKS